MLTLYLNKYIFIQTNIVTFENIREKKRQEDYYNSPPCKGTRREWGPVTWASRTSCMPVRAIGRLACAIGVPRRSGPIPRGQGVPAPAGALASLPVGRLARLVCLARPGHQLAWSGAGCVWPAFPVLWMHIQSGTQCGGRMCCRGSLARRRWGAGGWWGEGGEGVSSPAGLRAVNRLFGVVKIFRISREITRECRRPTT